jgi:aryl-alcohol dehydrogenase-like predicted oxidoreductase
MKTRKLGQTGIDVSAIALGCMSFVGFYGKSSRDEAFATLDAARDAGITFLDTSDMYGKGLSEEMIGEWQKDRGHRFQIATKGGIVAGAPRGTADNSAPYLREHLEGSLERLGVDSVELYYVHRREFPRPIEEVAETLEGFRQEGLIKGFGFSEISPAALRRAASVAPVAAVQNEYSLWTRLPDLGLVQTAKELGTTFVPFSPLGRGILSDHDLDPAAFGDTDFRKNNPRFIDPNFDFNMEHVRALRTFARDRGWTTSAVALAWTLHQGDHIVPIPGTRNPAHLMEWADADEIIFTESDRAALADIMPVGWAHGDRYSDAQIVGIERYC